MTKQDLMIGANVDEQELDNIIGSKDPKSTAAAKRRLDSKSNVQVLNKS